MFNEWDSYATFFGPVLNVLSEYSAAAINLINHYSNIELGPVATARGSDIERANRMLTSDVSIAG
jgi:hypothetical protein